MIRPRLTRRHVGALAVLALGGGVAVAQAAGGSGAASRSTTKASVVATPAGPPAQPVAAPAAGPPAPPVAVPAAGPPARPTAAPPNVVLAVRPPIGPCMPARRPAAGSPPSQALLGAFAILRRDRTAADELPAAALKALRLRGLEPVAPEAARLLRSDGDARAWVVPVPDVGRADALACLRGATRKRREGLAVVALGGAPAGGGGALRELVRGTAPVATDPCAGPAHDMLGVSGTVPDGVPAVFLTAPDGSAVRADVHDNGFAFVVPPARRPEPRYVVWTGSDGTPHVQPVGMFVGFPRGLCKRAASVAQVTPNGVVDCAPPALIAPRRGTGKVYVLPRPPRPPVVVVPGKRGRRVPPTAPPVFMPQPCALGGGLPMLVAPGVPPRAVPAPAPARSAPSPGVPPRAVPVPARPAPPPARPPLTAAP